MSFDSGCAIYTRIGVRPRAPTGCARWDIDADFETRRSALV